MRSSQTNATATVQSSQTRLFSIANCDANPANIIPVKYILPICNKFVEKSLLQVFYSAFGLFACCLAKSLSFTVDNPNYNRWSAMRASMMYAFT